MKIIYTLIIFILCMDIYSYDFKKDYIDKLNFKTYSSTLTMKMKKKGSSLSAKKILIKLKEKNSNQDILALFTEPSNMKGMAFLAKCNKDMNDKRFVYVRALRRVKKVPANADNYMLRDFLSLYLLKPRKELWNFKQIKESDKFFVIEAKAKNSSVVNLTGYSKLIHYINKKGNYIQKTEFYTDSKLVRTQEVVETKTINGINFVHRLKTHDKSENLDAEMIFDDITIDKDISDFIFTGRYLRSL